MYLFIILFFIDFTVSQYAVLLASFLLLLFYKVSSSSKYYIKIVIESLNPNFIHLFLLQTNYKIIFCCYVLCCRSSNEFLKLLNILVWGPKIKEIELYKMSHRRACLWNNFPYFFFTLQLSKVSKLFRLDVWHFLCSCMCHELLLLSF